MAESTGYKAPFGDRVIAGFVGAACLALLSVAAWLSPSDEGHGTHEQLGMPSCGWVARFQQPCPTCGMTTAFANAAEARWEDAFIAQPAGALGALLVSIVLWGSAHVAATGSRLGPIAARLLKPKVVWAGLAIGLASWGYKLATWDGAPADAPDRPAMTSPAPASPDA